MAAAAIAKHPDCSADLKAALQPAYLTTILQHKPRKAVQPLAFGLRGILYSPRHWTPRSVCGSRGSTSFSN